MNRMNQEQLEALQEAADNRIEVVKSKISPLDAKKFSIVNDCMKLLLDNDIPAFLFPLLHGADEDGNVYKYVYQYNTTCKLAQWNDSGSDLTEENHKKQAEYIAKALYTIFWTFSHGKDGQERYEDFCKRIALCIRTYPSFFQKNADSNDSTD